MAQINLNEDGLTPAQQGWADEYLVNGFNATQSYLHFHPNVSKRTAGVEGHKMKKQPNVKSYLLKRGAEVKSKYAIDQDWVVKRLLKLIDTCEAQIEKTAAAGGYIDSSAVTGLSKSLKQIAELAGLHTQKFEVKSSQAITINVVGSEELDFTTPTLTHVTLGQSSQLLDTQQTKDFNDNMTNVKSSLTGGCYSADTQEVKET